MTKKHEKKHEQAASEQPVQETVMNGADTAAEQEAVPACGIQDSSGVSATQTAGTEGDTATEKVHNASPSQTEQITALESKCKELQDQYLRKAADFDNYRKRMIREKQEAIDYANTNLLSDLLQILDDFDRAIEAGGKPEEGSPAAAFAQGVVMIRGSLLSLLESKYGLQYYEVQGKVFDPEIHEAVATNPSAEVTEPTVGAELQKGYKLKDRVLRSAKVMVLMPAPPTTEEQ